MLDGFGYGYGYAGGGFDDGYARDDGRETLTQIVVYEGHVLGVRHPPIRGSEYEEEARELTPRPVPPRVEQVVVHESPHELMADWLARAVGGSEALAGLDADPLPDGEPLERDRVPEESRELAVVVDELVTAAAAGWVVRGEMLTACRRLLVAASGAGLLRAWSDLEPDKVATSIVHCAAKANAFVGTGAAFTVAHWLRDLGRTSPPSSRSGKLATALGGPQWPHGRPPTEAPDVYLLGDPAFLVSRFRRELLAYRALTERVAAEQPTAS